MDSRFIDLVLAQAVACNLPIIASPDGGTCDLQESVAKPEYISIINEFSAGAIVEKMNEILHLYPQLRNNSYAGNALYSLTCDAYGERYVEFLHNITGK